MTTGIFAKSDIRDLKKSQKLLLYIVSALGECEDKTKLAKLQYFCDFISKAFYDASISGENYRYQRNKQGPLAYHFNEDLAVLTSNGFLSEAKKFHYKPVVCIDHLANEFEQNEIKVIDYVLLKYGKLNWRELRDISHEQVPYLSTSEMNEVPLFTAYNLVDDYPDFKK